MLVDMLVDLLVAKKVVEMDYLKVVVKVQLMVANWGTNTAVMMDKLQVACSVDKRVAHWAYE